MSRILANRLTCHCSQFLRFSTSAPLKDNIKICIVGGGPAGFYAAQHLVKALPNSEVDILERLPVPFGLVRFGVAPDHPEVKNVINTFTKTAKNPQVRFVGNVSIGKDVSLETLKDAYHAIVLTYGAEEDKTFGIPGEGLKNVLSAREFVGWYNGLPSNKDLKIDLSNEVAVILGQGNVAVDAARMLLTPIDELRKTDITEHALSQLASSKVRTVYLVGRRGPLQVAFTIKELREMINLKGCRTVFETKHFDGVREIIPKLVRPRKRLTELLVKAALDTPHDPTKESNTIFNPLFLRSPLRFLGDSALTGVEVGLNALDGPDPLNQKAVATGDKEFLQCGLALRSIGYRSICADPSIPFDEKTGRVKNEKGRVEPGVYTAGWLSTGPVGVILDTMSNAFETAGILVADIKSGALNSESPKPGFTSIGPFLKSNGVQTVSFEGWELIDKEERKRGEAVGKVREKIVVVKEMLEIADSGNTT